MGIINLTLLLIVARLGGAQFANTTLAPPPSTNAPQRAAPSNPSQAGNCDSCTIHGGEVQVCMSISKSETSSLSQSQAVSFNSLFTELTHSNYLSDWWPTASDGQQIKTINVDAAGFTLYV